MVKNNIIKKGFSLAEALVVMAVVAILFACATKVISTKPKQQISTTSHGYYECYLDGSTHRQHYVKDGVESGVQSGSCVFEPPAAATVFNITGYVNGYYSYMQPVINQDLTITLAEETCYSDTVCTTKNVVNFKSSTGTASLTANSSYNEVRYFLRAMYPDSIIYNNGSLQKGILISW